MGNDGGQRRLGEVAGVWKFTVQGLQIVKTNMATYKAQKVASSWIAAGIFICHTVLWLFDGSPDCVRTMYEQPDSVFKVNRGQQEAKLDPC